MPRVHALVRDSGAGGGAGRYYAADAATAQIGRMAVDASWRGRGAGALLLDTLVERAARAGFSRARLLAQTQATGFYRRAGFREYGEPVMDAGIPHQPMERTFGGVELTCSGLDCGIVLGPGRSQRRRSPPARNPRGPVGSVYLRFPASRVSLLPPQDAGSLTTLYVDETLSCMDCSRTFTFTAGEQQFFASKGFQNKPNRCPDCRTARKSQRAAGGGGGA